MVKIYYTTYHTTNSGVTLKPWKVKGVIARVGDDVREHQREVTQGTVIRWGE